MFAFRDIHPSPLPPVRIVDAGAAAYGADPHARLTQQGLCEVIGFEPHADNCARRNADAPPGHRYLPYFIGDGSTRRFHECQNPLTSSLYRPNAPLLAKFARLDLPVTAEHDVQTHRLDDLQEIGDVDYLKLDVQGAELDVIRGAAACLKTVTVVHTEVEFIPMYAEQPLFGDVDVALRAAGLWLHKLDGIQGRGLKPVLPKDNPYAPMSQILYADAAVYVRNFMSFDELPAEKLLKLALILHEIYGSFDLAALALRAHEAQTGAGIWQAYLERVLASDATA